MNYYKHHLGDYDGHTAHLSWLEDAAYRRLIGLYYRTEKPLPRDVAAVARLVRANGRSEVRAVGQVLEEFFVLDEDGWHNARCDAEIKKYQEKAARNRQSGQSGGRPPKDGTQTEPTNNPDGFQNVAGPEPKDNPSHKPLTTSQEPEKKERGDGADAPPPKSKALDVGVWEFDEKARGICLAEHLDPKEIQESVRDWAANATASDRRKKDPHAFLRKWCRTEAKRWKIPAFLDRNAGAEPLAEREYLGKTSIPMAQAKAHARMMNENSKLRPSNLSEAEVRELVAQGLVAAERAREWGYDA